MDFISLKARLRGLEPVFLPPDRLGNLRIIEKTGHAVCDITAEAAGDTEKIALQVEDVFSKAAGSDVQPRIRFPVHILYEAIALPDIDRMLVALADFIGDIADIHLTVHIDQPSVDWAALRRLATLVRDRLSRPKEVGIRLMAPFGEFDEVEMPKLFEEGVRVRFTGGWIKGGAINEFPKIDHDVLNTFSRFGFRTCIEWYTHAGNILEFEKQIPKLMIASYSSGFSLPLVSRNPYYRFDGSCPPLPDAVDYCQFLTRVYDKYCHYDDVMAPLGDLASLIEQGGWQSKVKLPSEINVIVDEKGNVGTYRHAAAFAKPWTSISEILSKSPESLRESLIHSAGESQSVKFVPYCRECDWRYICGGLDNGSAKPLSQQEADTLCAHRKLFLKHFARIRGTNCLIDK